ncbi:DJ-1/PfpI family protein [Corallococcus sp. ZKHCc1 1396]|uniref:DJ-1/PfpI family protein n=1 Tax=Corallococcus soli TaxID=2710757 RepID=A0ABR9PQ56_9BACT|nr:DJ-1/PfpI family protein [Corallococcus soli]MBE4750066.1 DJ-1/PfpI family protein [Corallococcus soli]
MLAQIVLFDGFDLLDALAPYEVLWAGGDIAGGALQVELVSFEGAREVPSTPTGMLVKATGRIDLERADLLILPGAAGSLGGSGPGSIPALLANAVGTGLSDVLEQALAKPGLTVGTVCGGSMLLGMAGLLKGRRATTNHAALEALKDTGADVIAARIVDDGNLVTAAGVTSGLDLGVYLLERMVGPRVAHGVEALFQFERRGTVWRAQGHEALAW